MTYMGLRLIFTNGLIIVIVVKTKCWYKGGVGRHARLLGWRAEQNDPIHLLWCDTAWVDWRV